MNEQEQLDNAPEGATHLSTWATGCAYYRRTLSGQWQLYWNLIEDWKDHNDMGGNIRSIEDMREIEKLKAAD